MCEIQETFHDVLIASNKLRSGQQKQTFRVSVDAPNGELLLSASMDPELEACRVLQARGATGKLRTRWHGKCYHAMIIPIAWGATRSTQGGDKSPIRIGRYQPLLERPFSTAPRYAVTEEA
jgi:hypothetical protein